MATRKISEAEHRRLQEDRRREKNWKRWGPYLSQRQWGTVREDYSADGSSWTYFPHHDAPRRAYRWGEDGLLGWCDRECRLCLAPALWNGKDPILKERLFGLDNHQGNHGEDCKELYYFLDAIPTYCYAKSLYKYPLDGYPYAELVNENARRDMSMPEYEIEDTGLFDDGRYVDLTAEYAKAGPNDILVTYTLFNASDSDRTVHLLPTLWFRNTWGWGCKHEGCTLKPHIEQVDDTTLQTDHETLGHFFLAADNNPNGKPPVWLFTENESNMERLWQTSSLSDHVKDAFHRFVVDGDPTAVSPHPHGTKAAAWYRLHLSPGESVQLRLRLYEADEAMEDPLGATFADIVTRRLREADAFHHQLLADTATDEERRVARQARAGLLWSKQFYHYSVPDWIDGDPGVADPPPGRRESIRNKDWTHLFNRDVLSMPDTWEYPWYAAWDLAFHMIPMATVDPEFAKEQLLLLLREWYMHPDGELPAYEWAFDDVNPPVHAWAVWRVYKISAPKDQRDRRFLERAFHKLMLNFTWWVNRKDVQGKNLFAGGFLGLDNIGVFDRSKPPPMEGRLAQADGTAWMAFFCLTMLVIAIELAQDNPAYEDVASKFFEHFVHIADAMNHFGGRGLWHEEDGFYYDHMVSDGGTVPMRIRSMVGLIPLLAVEPLHHDEIDRLPGFAKRMRWFLEHRRDLSKQISWLRECSEDNDRMLLAIPSPERLRRVLRYVMDPEEFLSPYGIRSLSKCHEDNPFRLSSNGQDHVVRYVPGPSQTHLFGGNSNWRGPVWFPVNFLFIDALERYHHFYGETFTCEYPAGSGQELTLRQIAEDLTRRLVSMFLPDDKGHRPCHGGRDLYARNDDFRNLVLFHEYFHGDNGTGLGASHQTGWTALVAKMIEDLTNHRQ